MRSGYYYTYLMTDFFVEKSSQLRKEVTPRDSYI